MDEGACHSLSITQTVPREDQVQRALNAIKQLTHQDACRYYLECQNAIAHLSTILEEAGVPNAQHQSTNCQTGQESTVQIHHLKRTRPKGTQRKVRVVARDNNGDKNGYDDGADTNQGVDEVFYERTSSNDNMQRGKLPAHLHVNRGHKYGRPGLKSGFVTSKDQAKLFASKVLQSDFREMFVKGFVWLVHQPHVNQHSYAAVQNDIYTNLIYYCAVHFLHQGFEHFESPPTAKHGRGNTNRNELYAKHIGMTYNKSVQKILRLGQRVGQLRGLLFHVWWQRAGILEGKIKVEHINSQHHDHRANSTLHNIWDQCYGEFARKSNKTSAALLAFDEHNELDSVVAQGFINSNTSNFVQHEDGVETAIYSKGITPRRDTLATINDQSNAKRKFSRLEEHEDTGIHTPQQTQAKRVSNAATPQQHMDRTNDPLPKRSHKNDAAVEGHGVTDEATIIDPMSVPFLHPASRKNLPSSGLPKPLRTPMFAHIYSDTINTSNHGVASCNSVTVDVDSWAVTNFEADEWNLATLDDNSWNLAALDKNIWALGIDTWNLANLEAGDTVQAAPVSENTADYMDNSAIVDNF